jgi:hypothetical protein
MTAIDYAFIGLPKSGKTTFLAALWHLIESGEISSKLTLDKLDGDHTHLTNLADLWRSGSQIPRTSSALEATVNIHIKDVATSKTYILSFPDIDGETFENQVENRTCNKEYFDSIESNTGIFLFVTANSPLELSLLQLKELMPTEDEASDTSTNQDSGENDEITEEVIESEQSRKPWAHKHIPIQVKVVELLQFLQEHPFKQIKRKISLMISAWDVVEPKCSPSEWLTKEMPLLDQYIKSNPHLFEIKLYGISALGGDIKDIDSKTRLLKMVPSERVTCECENEISSDITAPIFWMMTES